MVVDVKLIEGNKGNSGHPVPQPTRTSSRWGWMTSPATRPTWASGWWGKLYEEHGREVLHEVGGADHVLRGEWNRYTIEAVGHHVRTWLNGELCVDLVDPEGALGGILALQIHSGNATDVRFRAFELTLLTPEENNDR